MPSFIAFLSYIEIVSQFSTELTDSASLDSQRDPSSAFPAHPLGTQTPVLTLGLKTL